MDALLRVLNAIEEKLAMAFYSLLKMTLYVRALSHLVLGLYKDLDNDYASWVGRKKAILEGT